jgi:hypothetical protein
MIVNAMEMAVDPDDLLPASIAARQPQAEERGLAAGVGVSHHLRAGHVFDDLLGEAGGQIAVMLREEAKFQGCRHCLHDFGTVVAQGAGPMTHEEIDDVKGARSSEFGFSAERDPALT